MKVHQNSSQPIIHYFHYVLEFFCISSHPVQVLIYLNNTPLLLLLLLVLHCQTQFRQFVIQFLLLSQSICPMLFHLPIQSPVTLLPPIQPELPCIRIKVNIAVIHINIAVDSADTALPRILPHKICSAVCRLVGVNVSHPHGIL